MPSLHPLQTRTWGRFREKTGVKVIFGSDFVMTLHPVPKTPFTIGYLPKGYLPNKTITDELKKIGESEKCIFVQLEPNVKNSSESKIQSSELELRPSAHPLFTKYSFLLDLTPSEEELLKNMHQKTRYNIRVAQKKGVSVQEDNSDEAFETFLRLNHETNARQRFYSHPDSYFRILREVTSQKDADFSLHVLTATYQDTILVAWILFICGDTLYYPYGASSSAYREVMASNLMMWETIRFGKNHGLKHFDMWGALSENPNPKDPWFGFHRFKQGYGGKLTEFVGSYDLVINKPMYEIYKLTDKLRWMYLKLRK